ncbi:hypothetical protein MKK58_10400 [Methylobacterium sp. J-078]|uniref:hypothetical protein n=1 Tax=Methylobacterium sp. J-078 TaxID=2836657 RepID=UPI001FB8BB46|nr:hypothetical protein [Methylobacterium sp. J-078]MCJ2044932.1 hypothetical protein [Methylobacterium sp. J-078]
MTMIGTASAQVARFRIEDPLPDELKGRVAELMHSERAEDAEAAFRAAKVDDGHLWRKHGVLLLRVETGCDDDLCMVIIGQVTDQAIVPRLTLRAGPTITVGDELVKIWGVVSSLFIFEGREGLKIHVWSRGDKWLADACGDCSFGSGARSKEDPLPPPSIKSSE